MTATFDAIKWRGLITVEKFWTPDFEDGLQPFDVVQAENLLTTAGATAMWQKLCGQGSVTSYDGTNSYVCVGNGTTAAAVGDTNLSGGTKTRQVVDSAPVISGAGITFVSTFGTSTANHAWEEAGIANHTSAGILLNHVVQTFGTKTAGMTWVLTGSIGLS